ncbi:MAG: high-affinity Fe2+/Pb2+ permease [Sphingobacteriales bacterium]|jgi:high-affinity Fe2+/Pb2+ permease
MDIIFQSGEFYGQDGSYWTNSIAIIGAILGALVSGLIAIWIFKRGFKRIRQKRTPI